MDQEKEEKEFGDIVSDTPYYKKGLRYLDFDKSSESTDRKVMCENAEIGLDGCIYVEWKDKTGALRHIASSRAIASAAKHGTPENENETVLFVKTFSGSIYCFRNAQLNKAFITQTVSLERLDINVK